MFKTLKMKHIGLTAFSFICLIIFIGVCALMLRASAPDTVAIGGDSYSLAIKDDADIAAFLEACGYQAGELISQKDIMIPKHWNEVYTEYNELQRVQGFDLTPFKGKQAQELVYKYAAGDGCVTLLIGNGRIIAAHMCSSDGRDMRPLIKNGE